MWLIKSIIPLRKWNDNRLKTLIPLLWRRKSPKLEKLEALTSKWPVISCCQFSHASVIIASACKTKGLLCRRLLLKLSAVVFQRASHYTHVFALVLGKLKHSTFNVVNRHDSATLEQTHFALNHQMSSNSFWACNENWESTSTRICSLLNGFVVYINKQ